MSIGHGSSIYLMAPTGVGTVKTVSVFGIGSDLVTTSIIHQFVTGEPVVYETTIGRALPLVDGETYYVNVKSTTTFTLHETYEDAVADTNAIDMVGVGSGTQTMTSRRVTVGKCLNASLTGIQKATIDMTTFESSYAFREFESQLIDAGELTITTVAPINFVSDSTNYYSEIYENIEEVGNASRVWLSFPNGQNISCACEVTGCSVNDPIDDRIETEVTLKLTGQPTFNES